jgi:hypothetical protein
MSLGRLVGLPRNTVMSAIGRKQEFLEDNGTKVKLVHRKRVLPIGFLPGRSSV